MIIAEPKRKKGFPPANAGDARDKGSIPELGRCPEVGNWQPDPLFLPGESHEQRSLASYSPWGRKELDMTLYTHTHTQQKDFSFSWKRLSQGKNTLFNLLNLLFLYKSFLFHLPFGTCICSPLLQIQNCNSVPILNTPAFAGVIFGSLLISGQYQLLKFILFTYVYHVLCVFVGIFWHKINYCIAIKI